MGVFLIPLLLLIVLVSGIILMAQGAFWPGLALVLVVVAIVVLAGFELRI